MRADAGVTVLQTKTPDFICTSSKFHVLPPACSMWAPHLTWISLKMFLLWMHLTRRTSCCVLHILKTKSRKIHSRPFLEFMSDNGCPAHQTAKYLWAIFKSLMYFYLLTFLYFLKLWPLFSFRWLEKEKARSPFYHLNLFLSNLSLKRSDRRDSFEEGGIFRLTFKTSEELCPRLRLKEAHKCP